MEVRKTNRVILESDSLKSTNTSITSLILNEDQNQLESELSFLEDESELQSLSPQPKPDLLIDLGDMTTAAVLDLGHDIIPAENVFTKPELEPSVGVAEVGDDDRYVEPENLAPTEELDTDLAEVDDGLIDTNVKEQKLKETTIMEQSSSSTTSSTSSVVSASVVMSTSSTTSKSSVKASATTAAAKEITTAAAAPAINGCPKTGTLSTSSKSSETISVSTNNITSNNASNNENHNINEPAVPENTKQTNGTNKKKSRNNKTSSESISVVRRSFDGDVNSLCERSCEENELLDQVQNEDVSLSPGDDDKNPIILSRPSSIHRPKSCLGIPNEVASKRWASGDTNKSQNGAHIVFIPGDDFSGVSVNKLKSSFSKFDNLAKKEMQSTAASNKKSASDPQDQESPQVTTTPQPNHVCKGCNNEVFIMELLRAEKGDWHKNCFRCTVCNKSLTLDTYSSNEGNIFCKPHFKELFKPKAVAQTEEEINEKLRKKVEVIIRESEPVPLPPDVVRASEKSGPDIQDLKLDVKSKFQLFESFTNNAGTEEAKDNRTVEEISEELKRTGSVQSRLAKYQSRVAAATSSMEVTGVADEDLAGGGLRRRANEEGVPDEEGESSGDEVMDPRFLRKTQPVDEINAVAVDEVRSKWELGINSKKEEISEARKEEQSRFRSRLLMGKNTQMKDMYEKACEVTAPEKEQTQQSMDLDLVKTSEKKAKDLKEMFEKGEPLTPKSESMLEREVFDSEIAKNSRSLFKEIDKCVAAGTPVPISPNRNSQFKRQESNSIRKQELPEGTEVVRSSDVASDVVSPEDISKKFKFFETFEEKMSEKKSKERFRMTPPRDLGEVEPTQPVEIYRDPNIIRASDSSNESDMPATRTASKMLSVFRQLELEQNESGDAKKNFKPLKEFTPPRDTLKTTNGHDESGDSQGSDSGDEDEIDDAGELNTPKGGDFEKDELLKQVGSLARATSLRLKFERWEKDENAKNKDHGYDPNLGIMDEEQNSSNMASIESTKELRAKFENYKDSSLEQDKLQKMRRGESLKVKRFVELTNNTGVNMENCISCEKRVYVMEKVEAGGKVYHKTCFRCSHCKALLRMDTFTSNKGVLFCTPHFKQLFKIKGNYDEGFGHETHRQAWEKKKRAEGAEEKEN